MSAMVIHNNYRPGVSQRLGVDPKTLHELKPELIVLESPAYGVDGPKATRGGYDGIFQAMCGHAHRAGGPEGAPYCNRFSMCDYTGGLLGAAAILLGLYLNRRRGVGATLDNNLLNAGTFLLSELVERADGTQAGAPSLNRERVGFHPAEQLYATADGWIAVAARTEPAARILLTVLGLAEEVARPRASWGESEAALIAGAIARWNSAQLLAVLGASGVWAEECLREEAVELFRNADFARLGIIISADDPDYGEFKQIGALFRMERSSLAPSGRVPRCGEHTFEILRELGYSPGEIDCLYRRKVVI
jgi:crotonobetainyl-CoA:carnitine CoA-transferase CaiB-like acyl-CoA transferase